LPEQQATTIFERSRSGRLLAWLRALSRHLLRFLAFLAGAAWLLPILLLLGTGWLLYGHTVSRGIFVVRAPLVERLDAPDWFSGEDLYTLEKRVRAVDGRPLYDTAVASELASALASDPWVSEVRYVRRRFPSSLDCEIAVRKPFAGVEAGNKFFVVDRAGFRLPMPPCDVPPAGLPAVIGAKSYPSGPGELWKDPAVAAALFVLSQASDIQKLTGCQDMRVVAADVSVRNGLPSIKLRTAIGTSVEWGVVYRPGCEPYGVPAAGERLAALASLVSELGPDAVELVDVSVLPAAYRPRQ